MLEPQQSDIGDVDSLATAREHLLVANGLSLAALDRALGAALSRQLDYADLYLQLTRYETWTVEDGIVKEGAYSIDQGVGVRAVTGERTGFAYSDQLDEESLQDAVAAARGIARAQGSGKIKVARPVSYRPLYAGIDPLGSMSDSDKVQLLADIDQRTRAMDSRVIQVMASLAGVYEIVLLQASDGTLAADVRPLVRMNVSVILEKDGRREQGYAGGGGRGDYSVVTGNGRPLEIAAEAVRLAGVNMGAMPSPAGNMPVVLERRLARHSAARSYRPRSRGRLQPQRHVRLHRPDRRTRGDRPVHGRRRRHAPRAARLTERRRRGNTDTVQHADRAGRAERLYVRQAQRAAHGHALHRQRPA